MSRTRYLSGHIESQPRYIEKEMAEILGIEKEFTDYDKRNRRRGR